MDTNRKNLDELENLVGDIKLRIDRIEESIATQRSAIQNDFSDRIATIDSEISNQNKTISNVDSNFTNLQEALEIIKQEVDGLQINAMKSQKPWYKEASVIIALLSFLFSFSTTFVSYRRIDQQDTHEKRVELRGLIQRLVNLPKENFEILQKYPNDALNSGQLSGFLNTENALLANHAAEVIKQLPEDQVSAMDYLAVSNSLKLAGILDKSRELLKSSIKISEKNREFLGELSARRMYAADLITSGNIKEGREEYGKALGIFEKYPTDNKFYIDFTSAQTEIFWAQMEFSKGYCSEAKEHIKKAKEYARNLAPANVPNPMNQQALQAEKYIEGCSSNVPNISPTKEPVPPPLNPSAIIVPTPKATEPNLRSSPNRP